MMIAKLLRGSMSFREIRNFTESMKSLGYHRLISLENFRVPNFELVADILYWMAHRLDPGCALSDDISSEQSRIEFLKAVASVIYAKAQAKVNIKKLYGADGYAVKELLKVSTILYKSMRAAQRGEGDETNKDNEAEQVDLNELKNSRTLATAIVDHGAKIYSLLGEEEEMKIARMRVLKFLEQISYNLDSDAAQLRIEKALRSQVNTLAGHISTLENNCTGLETDKVSLKAKIDRKQLELDRAEKRLRSIKKVKPAFQAEYEQLERELAGVYAIYVEHTRNLQYLECELQLYQQEEEEKRSEAERALKKMQKMLRAEELRILRGEQDIDEDHIDDGNFDTNHLDRSSDGDIQEAPARPARPAAASRRGRPIAERQEVGPRVIGALGSDEAAGESDELSESDGEDLGALDDANSFSDMEENEEEEAFSDTDF